MAYMYSHIVRTDVQTDRQTDRQNKRSNFANIGRGASQERTTKLSYQSFSFIQLIELSKHQYKEFNLPEQLLAKHKLQGKKGMYIAIAE
jgi:hypothetical protein